MTTLAKKLPGSKAFPRYCSTGQAVTDCAPDSKGKAVRLSTRCWISTQRWNEIAANADTLESAKATAMSESQTARRVGKAQYAQFMNRLALIDLIYPI